MASRVRPRAWGLYYGFLTVKPYFIVYALRYKSTGVRVTQCAHGPRCYFKEYKVSISGCIFTDKQLSYMYRYRVRVTPSVRRTALK